MDLFQSMEISGNGLHAQRTVLNTVSTNLANIQTSRTEDGRPYRRKRAVLSSAPVRQEFGSLLAQRTGGTVMGVKAEVVEESEKVERTYDPSHPDADETGYVSFPAINVMEEMRCLLSAMHNFEANLTAFNSAKNMALKSLEIGK